jgi:ribonuclease Z
MDHWADFDRLLRPMVGRAKLLRVVGPEGFATRLHHRLASYTWNLVDRIPYDLVIEAMEVQAGELPRTRLRLQTGFAPEALAPAEREADGTVLRLGGLRLRAGLLDHGTVSVGFALEEDAHLNVLASRLASRGLPAGAWLTGLKAAVAEGRGDGHPVPVFARPSEAEGAPVRPLGELRELVTRTAGQRVAYLTDFADTPGNRDVAVGLAAGADTLFIEAPFLAGDAAHAAGRMHLTTAAAGEIARAAGARRVQPFHMSPRHLGAEAQWRAEIEAAFGGAVMP